LNLVLHFNKPVHHLYPCLQLGSVAIRQGGSINSSYFVAVQEQLYDLGVFYRVDVSSNRRSYCLARLSIFL